MCTCRNKIQKKINKMMKSFDKYNCVYIHANKNKKKNINNNDIVVIKLH